MTRSRDKMSNASIHHSSATLPYANLTDEEIRRFEFESRPTIAFCNTRLAVAILKQNTYSYRGQFRTLFDWVRLWHAQAKEGGYGDVEPLFFAERELYFALKNLELSSKIDECLNGMLIRKSLIEFVLSPTAEQHS